jgi:hypothetical protein
VAAGLERNLFRLRSKGGVAGGPRHRGPGVSISEVNVSLIYATQTAVVIGHRAQAENSISVGQVA